MSVKGDYKMILTDQQIELLAQKASVMMYDSSFKDAEWKSEWRHEDWIKTVKMIVDYIELQNEPESEY